MWNKENLKTWKTVVGDWRFDYRAVVIFRVREITDTPRVRTIFYCFKCSCSELTWRWRWSWQTKLFISHSNRHKHKSSVLLPITTDGLEPTHNRKCHQIMVHTSVRIGAQCYETKVSLVSRNTQQTPTYKLLGIMLCQSIGVWDGRRAWPRW